MPDAGVAADDAHVGRRVADRHLDLVEAPGDEAGERAAEGDLARQRQAGRDADHVGLGDAPSGRSAAGTSGRTSSSGLLSERSASSTTSSGWVSPRRAIASPKASREATDVPAGPALGRAAGAHQPSSDCAARSSATACCQLLLVRRDAVPADLLLHERDALALDRLGDDERRLPLGRPRRRRRRRRSAGSRGRRWSARPVERAPLVGDRLRS